MKTEIICIVDRSGSMQSMAADAIGGFNAFIEDQKKVEGKARVTFVQFDDQYETVYEGKKLKGVPVLDSATFVPRGTTALLDAIGMTISHQKARILADKWADKVVIVILTDGGENASREYTLDKVQELTKKAQADGWSFVYLGANQDSFAAAKSFGIDINSKSNAVANYLASGAGMRGASQAYSMSVSNIRTTGSAAS